MQNFENTPEMLALKGILREFFLGIIENIKGAFIGFCEWIVNLDMKLPPMLKFFGNAKINGVILVLFLVYTVFMNIKTYRMFAHDKQYAVENKERISEKRLLAHTWIGGACGALIAMYVLQHKTRHKVFVVSAWLSVAIYLVCFSVIFGFLSFWTFL